MYTAGTLSVSKRISHSLLRSFSVMVCGSVMMSGKSRALPSSCE
jgi:hypothetical protein